MTEAWRRYNERRPLPPLLGEVKEIAIDELHRRLAEEGFDQIRPSHGCVFRFVERGGSRLTDLAARSGFTKQAVGEVADHLESLGYVERAPDPGDRRAKLIGLTDRGADAQAAAMRIFADIERRWAERYGDERIAALREMLEEIVAVERAPAAAA
ncbi:MAG: MarR family winged helix-turn-helix transcriptional regulator [Thermoleophilaceae bacterium]|jgi:DNA-binding MarR family transcriptional regulator